jgi:hypothetical protein
MAYWLQLKRRLKMTNISRGLTSIFLAICFLFPLVQSQEAYAEMKKVSGTSKQIAKLFADETFYDQTKVRFLNNLQMYSSDDPDWDKAKVFSVYFYVNPTRQGDDFNGCLAITHTNGDQTFIKYEGSWKWVSPRDGYRWDSETKGVFTGGTGRFKGIKGTLSSKGKGNGRKDLGGEWEIKYEIAPTNN